MKFTFKGQFVVAEAESVSENITLMSIGEKKDKIVHRKHKKHNFTKVCDVCGRSCKGLRGLMVHKALSHRKKALLDQGGF